MGSSCSVFDAAHMGSTLSVRGLVRMGSVVSLADSLQVGGRVNFPGIDANTYIRTDSGEVQIYVSNSKSITFDSNGGELHGNWHVENSIITSDRRLKKDIAPLQRTLRDAIVPKGDAKATGSKDLSVDGNQGDGALWMLRQLRPVSYSFRKGADSKNMRFGFIADELETVIPQVVRRSNKTRDEVPNQMAVMYSDLIALLAAATQSQQQVIEAQRSKMDELENYQSDLTEQTRKLIAEVKQMKIEEERLEREEQERQRRMRKRKKKAPLLLISIRTSD